MNAGGVSGPLRGSNSSSSNHRAVRVLWVLAVLLVPALLLGLLLLRSHAELAATHENICTMTYSRPVFEEVPVQQTTFVAPFPEGAQQAMAEAAAELAAAAGPDAPPPPQVAAAAEMARIAAQPPAVGSAYAYKYKLYRYYDGGVPPAGDATAAKSPLVVIFVPGHLGSYKTIRSLASVSAGLGDAANIHFYALDFEELSGLFGVYISQQAEFLNDAIRVLHETYSESVRIAIVAHSSGAMVARRAVGLKTHPPGSIMALICLAAAQQRAVFEWEPSMVSLVSSVNMFWSVATGFAADPRPDVNSTAALAYSLIRDTVIMSINTGIQDTMLMAPWASLQGLVPASQACEVSTTAIPKVHLSMDHLAILWCNEFVRVLAQLLHNWQQTCAHKCNVMQRIQQASELGLCPRNIATAPLTAPRSVFAAASLVTLFMDVWSRVLGWCIVICTLVLARMYAASREPAAEVRTPLKDGLFLALEELMPLRHLPLLLAPLFVVSRIVDSIVAYIGLVLVSLPGVGRVLQRVSRPLGRVFSWQNVLRLVTMVALAALSQPAVRTLAVEWLPVSSHTLLVLGMSYLLAVGVCCVFTVLIFSVSSVCTTVYKATCARACRPTGPRRGQQSSVAMNAAAVAALAVVIGVTAWYPGLVPAMWRELCLERAMQVSSFAFLAGSVLVIFSPVYMAQKHNGSQWLAIALVQSVQLLVVVLLNVGYLAFSYEYWFAPLDVLAGASSPHAMRFIVSVGLIAAANYAMWLNPLGAPILPSVHKLYAVPSVRPPFANQVIDWIYGSLLPTFIPIPALFAGYSTGAPQVARQIFSNHASCAVCCHEEGGAHALYMETDARLRVQISSSVWVGPTFRVISCKCKESLDPVDFCDFCKCRCTACGADKAMSAAESRRAAATDPWTGSAMFGYSRSLVVDIGCMLAASWSTLGLVFAQLLVGLVVVVPAWISAVLFFTAFVQGWAMWGFKMEHRHRRSDPAASAASPPPPQPRRTTHHNHSHANGRCEH